MSNMGFDETWILNALQDILPEQTLTLLHSHILSPSSPARTLASRALSSGSSFTNDHLGPVLDRGATALSDAPDVVWLGILILGAYIGLRVLLLVRRTISFVTRLAFRALFYGLVGLAIMAAWKRGPDAVVADVMVVGKRLLVYAAVVKDIWVREYQKYDAQTRSGAAAAGSGGGAMGGRSAAGHSGGRWGSH